MLRDVRFQIRSVFVSELVTIASIVRFEGPDLPTFDRATNIKNAPGFRGSVGSALYATAAGVCA